jgi:tRNA (cytidine32/uridine32-2'-O)-methyltransferase
MKTMGLSELTLVRPKSFPDPEATARASGANDLLERAVVVDSLNDAIADCRHVTGASARTRSNRWPLVDPRQCATQIVQNHRDQVAAVVMGPEKSGLTNEDLARCHSLVHIPTAPDYGSLNIAMAVQVICYEIRMAALAAAAGLAPHPQPEQRDAPAATAAEVEGMQQHLEELLTDSGFLHPDHPNQLRRKLRRIFMRAELDQTEINILRGAFASLDPRRGGRRF